RLLPGKMRTGSGHTLFSETCPQIWISEDLAHLSRELTRVLLFIGNAILCVRVQSNVDKVTGHTIQHDLWRTTHSGSNYRERAGHGLQGRQPKWLINRRAAKNRGLSVQNPFGRIVILVSNPDNIASFSQNPDSGAYLGFQARTARKARANYNRRSYREVG